MQTFLFVSSSIVLLLGFIVLGNSENVIQETAGLVAILIGAVLFIGAAIVGAIDQLGKKLESINIRNRDIADYRRQHLEDENETTS